MGKFSFDLDYRAYQSMLEKIKGYGVSYTELLPLIADVEGHGIYTLIGIVDAPTGNNLIPEIACSSCAKTVMGVLEGGAEKGNFCACSECGNPITKCVMFRISDEQLNAARMLSEVQVRTCPRLHRAD